MVPSLKFYMMTYGLLLRFFNNINHFLEIRPVFTCNYYESLISHEKRKLCTGDHVKRNLIAPLKKPHHCARVWLDWSCFVVVAKRYCFSYTISTIESCSYYIDGMKNGRESLIRLSLCLIYVLFVYYVVTRTQCSDTFLWKIGLVFKL